MTRVLALFDLDGTLSSRRIWEGFVKYYFIHKKRRAWVLAFWAAHSALWLFSEFKLGNKDKYRTKWMEDLAAIFKGLSREEALGVFHWVADNYMFKSLRTDVIGILNEHKESGHTVIIISTIFAEFLDVIKQRLGVVNVIGTRLEMINGKYTGKIVQPLCFGENKAKLLKEFLDRDGLEIDSAASYAYTDSAFDVPLLKLVGNPVATYPSRHLRQLAERNGWRILP
jgi:HAD superfamily hydrolase (TIGR01490 family)